MERFETFEEMMETTLDSNLVYGGEELGASLRVVSWSRIEIEAVYRFPRNVLPVSHIQNWRGELVSWGAAFLAAPCIS